MLDIANLFEITPSFTVVWEGFGTRYNSSKLRDYFSTCYVLYL